MSVITLLGKHAKFPFLSKIATPLRICTLLSIKLTQHFTQSSFLSFTRDGLNPVARDGTLKTSKSMPDPEIAITVHEPQDSLSRPSEDFELVRYPTHTSTDWKSSQLQEEQLPYYMTEDTSARRRVIHHPQGPTPPQHDTRWVDEYDGEGKDVYAKATAFQKYGGGGRVARRGPPPPPASIVRLVHCLPTPSCPLTINLQPLFSPS